MTHGHQVLIYSMSYLLFFIMLLLSKGRQGNRLVGEKGVISNRGILLLSQVAGIFLLALSFCFLGQPIREIVFGKNSATDLQLLVCGLFVIIALLIAPVLAEKKICLLKDKRPVNSFSASFVANYFFVRILFLGVYEIWFRGYLLMDCLNNWNVRVAIAVNIVLYILLHSVNGKDEMRGCVLFGLLLCILCSWIGAAWPAMAIHIAFAISYETHLVRRINKPSISFI